MRREWSRCLIVLVGLLALPPGAAFGVTACFLSPTDQTTVSKLFHSDALAGCEPTTDTEQPPAYFVGIIPGTIEPPSEAKPVAKPKPPTDTSAVTYSAEENVSATDTVGTIAYSPTGSIGVFINTCAQAACLTSGSYPGAVEPQAI